MKNYAVIRVMSVLSPSVVFQCNDYEDALTYAQVVSKQDNYEYVVVKAMNSFKTIKED